MFIEYKLDMSYLCIVLIDCQWSAGKAGSRYTVACLSGQLFMTTVTEVHVLSVKDY